MTSPFHLDIHMEETDFHHIRRFGFVKCEVRHQHTTSTKYFGYCMHCKTLFSISWAKRHSIRLRNKGVNVSGFFNSDKTELYRLDIISELEIRIGKESSAFRTIEPGNDPLQISPDVDGSMDSDMCDQPAVPPQKQVGVAASSFPSVPDPAPFQDQDTNLCSDHEMECAEECILRDSFCQSEFDGERFLSLSETIVNSLFGSDRRKAQSFKTGIVSSLLRKMSILLSLSKTQNEQLLKFWKSMVIFRHPSSEETVNKIRASYSSCQRQCLRDEEVGKKICRQYMEDYSHFSIAVDSALIRRRHVLSCFVRFSFQESITQIPLFFTVCSFASGQDLHSSFWTNSSNTAHTLKSFCL